VRASRRNSCNLARASTGVSDSVHMSYGTNAIRADSFARVLAFAISQPDDVDINEFLFRPTSQEM
jgi:NADP-dependent 3-hydroxy acid dehydrogenase YdfG